MKIVYMILFLLLSFSVFASEKCLECHQPSDVLPKNHEQTEFKISSCTECHVVADMGKSDPFLSGVHLKHAGNAECNVCHIIKGEKPFTLAGAKEGKATFELDLIKEMTVHWQTSTDLDKRHAEAGVFCSGCHGKELPAFSAQVDNSVCLTCHGPLDKLQKKTEPAEHKDRNPHKSHLGNIECSVCHITHSEQTVYCKNCHPKFKMTMP